MHGDRYLGGGHPRPYLDDQIEYPVLLGLFLWLPHWLPGGAAAHFTVTYLLLALCLLAALLALERIPGARPAWLAATPALALYAGLNWDLFPIALLALAALELSRQRRPRGRRGHRARHLGQALPGRAGAAGSGGALGRGGATRTLAAAGSGRRRCVLAAVVLVVNLPFATPGPGELVLVLPLQRRARARRTRPGTRWGSRADRCSSSSPSGPLLAASALRALGSGARGAPAGGRGARGPAGRGPGPDGLDRDQQGVEPAVRAVRVPGRRRWSRRPGRSSARSPRSR